MTENTATTLPQEAVTQEATTTNEVVESAQEASEAVKNTNSQLLFNNEAPAETKPETAETPAIEEKPIDYTDFTLPEENIISDARLGQFKEVVKGLNLTQEQAQSILNVVGDVHNDYLAARDALFNDWKQKAQNDPDIGGAKLNAVVERVNAMVHKFAANDKMELNEVLSGMGLGNNPIFIKFLDRIAQAIAEDSISGTTSMGSQVAKKDRLQVLYPNN